MIIKKKNFNLTPRCRGKWPFTVPEVAVILARVDDKNYYAIAHNFGLFALNKELLGRGFAALDQSGIWGGRPLVELLYYLNRLVNASVKKKGVNGEKDA